MSIAKNIVYITELLEIKFNCRRITKTARLIYRCIVRRYNCLSQRCGLPVIDCRVAWPEVTSSVRRPVSGDVISDGRSPARRPTGARYRSHLRDNRPDPPRSHDTTTPCCGHVTFKLLPVCRVDAASQSGGTTSSSASCRHFNSSSSSRPDSDVTVREVSQQSAALFTRLSRLTESHLATRSPANMWAGAFATALHGPDNPSRAIPPDDAVLPLFHDTAADLRRRGNAAHVTRRPTLTAELLTGVSPLFRPATARSRLCLQREISQEANHSESPMMWDAQRLFCSDSDSMRTLTSHVSQSGRSSAVSLWTSLLQSTPHHLAPAAVTEQSCQPYQRTHHTGWRFTL